MSTSDAITDISISYCPSHFYPPDTTTGGEIDNITNMIYGSGPLHLGFRRFYQYLQHDSSSDQILYN